MAAGKRIGLGIGAFARRFAAARRGNVAMIFALCLPIMIMITMGGVDIHRASTVRLNLQDALDAAALAAARSPYATDAELTDIGLKSLRANLQGYPDINLREDLTRFTLNEDQVVIASAKVDVKTLVAGIVLPPYGRLLDDVMTVGSHSEVNRSSRDVEVAMVLDISGSMAGQRIIDLRSAANELVDIVVQDQQAPFYSKMALVPYSVGVNVGDYADTARGPLTGSTRVTGAAWADGSERAISTISRANPAEVTAPGHGLSTGDHVWIRNVTRMTALNNKAYRVTRVDANRFRLDGVSTASGYSQNGSGGTVRKCLVADCALVVTSSGHGLDTDDYVFFTGVGGLGRSNSSFPHINNNHFQVVRLDSARFSISAQGPNYGNYSSGGQAWCARQGCEYYVFTTVRDSLLRLPSSTCVSERTGPLAYSDAAPTGASSWVGRAYLAGGTACPSHTVVPLTSDRATLQTNISALQTGSGTAGQIGAGWGWYMVSPVFGSIFPSDSQPAAYNPFKTLKVVVLMTDGAFNTPYCRDTLSNSAGVGGNNRINCGATNGDAFNQAAQMCDAMKGKGVVIYTVGFAVGTGTGRAGVIDTARDVMEYCGSSPDHVHLAASGTDLKEAFRAIGRDITRLRISR